MMEPYWKSNGSTLLHGDCRPVMRSMPEKSVQCCVTSPPYWGLRSYEGVERTWWGGDNRHSHIGEMHDGENTICGCGAWRGHLGLEPTPEMYVEHIVEVFRDVWRVLRDDGTLFCNLGDSYAQTGKSMQTSEEREKNIARANAKGYVGPFAVTGSMCTGRADRAANTAVSGLKPKDLCGIPWRVAFALQADGWYLRSDIIWAKPNPMPESVTDRPTKAHEYVFLMTKKPRYYFDAEAVREKGEYGRSEWNGDQWSASKGIRGGYKVAPGDGTTGRNLRSVWSIPTQGFKAAHFATYPEKLVAICLKAGTSSKGCCPECGTPWVRLVEKERVKTRPGDDTKCFLAGGGVLFKDSDKKGRFDLNADIVGNRDPYRHVTQSRTVGWEPVCKCGRQCDTPCNCGEFHQFSPDPCTVLDPFIGSGTTGVVAKQLGLEFIGIDASKTYLDMARRRIENPNPEPEKVDVPGQELLNLGEAKEAVTNEREPIVKGK